MAGGARGYDKGWQHGQGLGLRGLTVPRRTGEGVWRLERGGVSGWRRWQSRSAALLRSYRTFSPLSMCLPKYNLKIFSVEYPMSAHPCLPPPQARNLKDALVAMDRTLSNVRDFVNWHAKYPFLRGPDLEAWQRITWWDGPDDEGYLWLVIDNKAAVSASKTHGPELVARILISNVSGGVGRCAWIQGRAGREAWSGKRTLEFGSCMISDWVDFSGL